jgi:lysophospholipase L1-like esterase
MRVRSRRSGWRAVSRVVVAAWVAFVVVGQGAARARAQAAAAQAAVAPAPARDVPSCVELAAALSRVSTNDVRLRDWPNLARYRDANRTTSGTRVVFMGDSITDFWQQPRFGGFFPGQRYADRGISGQTTPQMLLRFRADVIDLRPQAVVILGGTNDIAGATGQESNEEIEGNLASMSELAHASGIAVVFASLTPVSAYHVANATAIPQTTLRPMDRIRAVNTWLAAYAAAHGDVYLDYFSALIDATGLLGADFSADDLHPTSAGYAVMAPLAEAAIARALKK